jgi:hypothetical protein
MASPSAERPSTVRAVIRTHWLRYALLGFLVAAAVTDKDAGRTAGLVVACIAGVALISVAYQMLVKPRIPTLEQRRATVAKLETDPDTQFHVHRIGVLYWLLNFPVIVWLFFWHQDFWLVVGVFITLLYSVYANLATDYSGMSSAMAAKGIAPPPEIPLQDE